MFTEKLLKTLDIQTGIYEGDVSPEFLGYAWFSVKDDVYGETRFVVSLDGNKCIGKDISGEFMDFLSDDDITVLEKWGIQHDEKEEDDDE